MRTETASFTSFCSLSHQIGKVQNEYVRLIKEPCMLGKFSFLKKVLIYVLFLAVSGLLSNCGERGLPSGRDERASLAGEHRPQGAQTSGVVAPGL